MSQIFDRLGLASSLVCGVHCIISPIIFGYLFISGLPALAHDHLIDWSFFLLTLAFGSLSLGQLKNRRVIPIVTFLAGAVILAAGLLIEDQSPLWHTGCMVAGAILVSLSHILNLRTQKDLCSSSSHKAPISGFHLETQRHSQ